MKNSTILLIQILNLFGEIINLSNLTSTHPELSIILSFISLFISSVAARSAAAAGVATGVAVAAPAVTEVVDDKYTFSWTAEPSAQTIRIAMVTDSGFDGYVDLVTP